MLNPTSYIVSNGLPKFENVKRILPDLYRDEPVLVMADKQPGN